MDTPKNSDGHPQRLLLAHPLYQGIQSLARVEFVQNLFAVTQSLKLWPFLKISILTGPLPAYIFNQGFSTSDRRNRLQKDANKIQVAEMYLWRHKNISLQKNFSLAILHFQQQSADIPADKVETSLSLHLYREDSSPKRSRHLGRSNKCQLPGVSLSASLPARTHAMNITNHIITYGRFWWNKLNVL